MTAKRITCARCHRALTREPTLVAGMPLGPTCAGKVTAAARPAPTRAERRASQREAAFMAAQLPLIV